MQDLASKPAEKSLEITKNQSFLTGSLELIPGFEPGTSSLPRMRSTY